MTRLIIVLLIFFGVLFYFRGPLSQVPAEFSQLHSPYVQSFKRLFNEVLTASSSTVIGGYKNYIPGFTGASSSVTGAPVTSFSGSTNSTPAAGQQNSSQGNASNSVSANVNGGEGSLLPVTSNEGEGHLSAGGIITDTNKERASAGIPSLSLNKILTASAEAKLQDMFQNQYFAHISPSGENVANVVTRAGYQYIVVGENLALGLFPSDASVVAAWMASPGHKKNILDPRYKEIGVAVGQGMYQGRKQWLIVQHFGKPLYACPSPSADLKNTITVETSNLATLEQKINTVKAEVDQSVGKSEYWADVDQYNALVTTYNDQRASLKAHLDTYNASVKVFNECIGADN